MIRRRFFGLISVLILLVSVSLSGLDQEVRPEYKSTGLRTGALLTGAALGAGVITFYSFGPYSEFDFQNHAPASVLMVGTSSSIMMSTSILHSTFLAKSIYDRQNSMAGGAFKGAWTGALAGGVSNGLSFACILGIGHASGVIRFNDPDLNGTQAMLNGLAGGFLYGAAFGAVIGCVEGIIYASVQKKLSRGER